MMKNILMIFAFISVVATSTAQDQIVSKSFSGIKSIGVRIARGSIDVRKGRGNDVKIEVKYSYEPSIYRPTFETNGSRLYLEEEFERSDNWGNSKWLLEIPNGVEVTLNTGSGNIFVEGLSTTLNGHTGSGRVYLSNVKGDLDFSTGAGEIEIETGDGDINLNTGSGRIRAKNCTGFVFINGGSGEIRLEECSADFAVNSGTGDIRGNALTLTGSSTFNTGSGDATVTLGGPLNHNISIECGSGDATLNFAGMDISGIVIMTSTKRGAIIAPFKFDSEQVITEYNNPRIQKMAKLGSKDIRIKLGTASGIAEIIKE